MYKYFRNNYTGSLVLGECDKSAIMENITTDGDEEQKQIKIRSTLLNNKCASSSVMTSNIILEKCNSSDNITCPAG